MAFRRLDAIGQWALDADRSAIGVEQQHLGHPPMLRLEPTLDRTGGRGRERFRVFNGNDG